MTSVDDTTFTALSRSALEKVKVDHREVVRVVEQAYLALAEDRSANPRKLTVKPDDDPPVAYYAMLGRDGGCACSSSRGGRCWTRPASRRSGWSGSRTGTATSS